MQTIDHAIAQAEQRCQSNGARLTEKRKQVLSLLLKSGKALSAYELVNAYKDERGETLSAMSMYRFLEFLEEQHLVHRLDLANKFVACEHIECVDHHTNSQFLICSECQKVKEVTISETAMQELRNNVMQAGFSLRAKQLEMDCICNECASN